MSELRIEHCTIPSAPLGAENPYPQFPAREDDAPLAVSADIPDEMRRRLAYGHLRGLLPYTLQDGYTRARVDTPLKMAVLENETLRAAFLLDYGGRLWSLTHKPSGRELLYRNPVIQPGNLAHRNAWICGGVEWNTGATGHTPFTCAPLFAGRLRRADGAPILRMYEFERWREVVYQIDACLPPGSPVLLVQVCLRNPNPAETPVYWWSNIAAPENADTRVVVPAERAFHFDLQRSGLGLIPTPLYEGIDYTYSTRVTGHSADFFFDLPPAARPYICALDGAGSGLAQTSTARLKGRKLFLWGGGRGGQRWQGFLSPAGGKYLEIQAGLAATQLEHLPMPGGAEWAWLEAYGLLQADPAAVHGADWAAARSAVEESLEALLPADEMERQHALSCQAQDAPLEELLHHGSGWGALEEARRAKAGLPPLGGARLPFERPADSAPLDAWFALLASGRMDDDPAANPDACPPAAFQTAPAWRALLEAAISGAARSSWLAWYYLGVARANALEEERAITAFRVSLDLRETAWAHHNLAMLRWRAGQMDAAAQHLRRALALRPADIPLYVQAGQFFLAAGQPEAFRELLANAPAEVRAWGRVRFLEARAALLTGDLDAAARYFSQRVELPDLREGEDSLSGLWFDLQRAKRRAAGLAELDARALEKAEPIPDGFDFRMHVAE